MPSGSYLDRSSLFHFQSSLGADITYDYQTCGLSFSCDMAEGEKKFSGHWQKGATRFDELKGLTETIRAAMAEQTAFLRSSVPVEPGKYPVVLSPEAAGVFAHESFGHKSESDFMLSDEAMRDEWQLGKTVGSPILSIAECGSVPGCGYVPYDDEGTKARKNYLIKNGVLAGRLHSAQTALKNCMFTYPGRQAPRRRTRGTADADGSDGFSIPDGTAPRRCAFRGSPSRRTRSFRCGRWR